MICIKTEIPEELNKIDDELKAIYHSSDTVCFYIFKTRELRNEFIEKTKGMNKEQREQINNQIPTRITRLERHILPSFNRFLFLKDDESNFDKNGMYSFKKDYDLFSISSRAMGGVISGQIGRAHV